MPGMRCKLDTNVVSDIVRHHDGTIARHAESHFVSHIPPDPGISHLKCLYFGIARGPRCRAGRVPGRDRGRGFGRERFRAKGNRSRIAADGSAKEATVDSAALRKQMAGERGPLGAVVPTAPGASNWVRTRLRNGDDCPIGPQ